MEEFTDFTDKPCEIRINYPTAAEVLHDAKRKLYRLSKLLQKFSIRSVEPFVLMRRAKSTQRHRSFRSHVPLQVSPVPVYGLQIKQINKSKHAPVLFVGDVFGPSVIIILVVPSTAFTYAQTIFIQFRMLGANFFIVAQRKLSA
jgi:hypothetical protein